MPYPRDTNEFLAYSPVSASKLMAGAVCGHAVRDLYGLVGFDSGVQTSSTKGAVWLWPAVST